MHVNVVERAYGIEQAKERLGPCLGGTEKVEASYALTFRDPWTPRAEPWAAAAPPQPARSQTSKTSTVVAATVLTLPSGPTQMPERSKPSNEMLK